MASPLGRGQGQRPGGRNRHPRFDRRRENQKSTAPLIRIIFTRRAEEELRAIWRYIAEDNDNEPAADRILLAIGEKSNCCEAIPAWPAPFRHRRRCPAADRGPFSDTL